MPTILVSVAQNQSPEWRLGPTYFIWQVIPGCRRGRMERERGKNKKTGRCAKEFAALGNGGWVPSGPPEKCMQCLSEVYPWKKGLYLCAGLLSLHSTREAPEQTAGRCTAYTWSWMLSAWSGSKWCETVHCSCSWNPRWAKGMQYGAPQPSATPADFPVSCQPELHHLAIASWETNILAHPASRIEARREEDYWWKGKL